MNIYKQGAFKEGVVIKNQYTSVLKSHVSGKKFLSFVANALRSPTSLSIYCGMTGK